jgi:hypothetical protein
VGRYLGKRHHGKPTPTKISKFLVKHKKPVYVDSNDRNIVSFAASAATQEELDEAKRRREIEKSKPVKTERRIWRPQVTSQYKEPDCIPDPMSDLEILYKDFGKPLWATKNELPPRNDLIKFIPKIHGPELENNLQWKDCPENLRPRIKNIILEYWDVFAEEGVRKHIRGFQFHVDTGEVAPVCVKPPRYGPHESRVINELIDKLEANDIIEDDDGPWGAPIVLAAKANQEHLHWSQYVWRLCVSYRKLNAIVRPFTFPIMRCDDAVREIGDSRCFITLDLDSGYWQVECESSSKAKLAFFTPTGKKRFKTMPMGATNAHPVFVAIVACFKKKWDALACGLHLENTRSAVIVDDIILSAQDEETLINYFVCILKILQHHRATVKLKKCRFFPSTAEFVGLDIHKEGNSPAKSKFEAFKNLGPPNTFTDLNMLIGCFGFYQEHIPLYEARIKRWRDTQKLRPPPGTPKKEDSRIISENWNELDNALLEELKNDILSEPILQRPNPNLRFYLKTDWSKNAMGAALLQPAPCEAALASMNSEINGESCNFDLTKSGLRLHPIAFISRRTSTPERSYHSYVGEACAGIWAIEKFRPYLFGKEFTWLTDCSGLRKFFEGDDIPTHMIQRWRMQLLRYDFTIVHRPGRMMFECDLLSRYNQETQAWREAEPETTNPLIKSLLVIKQPDPIPWSHERIKFTKGNQRNRLTKPNTTIKQNFEECLATELEQTLLESYDKARNIWAVEARLSSIIPALEDLGIETNECTQIEGDTTWAARHDSLSWDAAFEEAQNREETPDWLIIPNHQSEENNLGNIRSLIKTLAWKGLKAAIVIHDKDASPNSKAVHATWNNWTKKALADLRWAVTTLSCTNPYLGGVIEGEYKAFILAPNEVLDRIRQEGTTLPEEGLDKAERPRPLEEILEKPQEQAGLQVTTERNQTHSPETPCYQAKRESRVTFTGHQLEFPVFSSAHVCPNLTNPGSLGPQNVPLISCLDESGKRIIRNLTWVEAARALGIEDSLVKKMEQESWDTTEIWNQLRAQPPKEVLRAIFARLLDAEIQTATSKAPLDQNHYKSEQLQDLLSLTKPEKKFSVFQTKIDRWTVIPLPTHKKWAEAVEHDKDLTKILEALQHDRHLERHRIANKQYHDAWEKGQLEQEDGIIYHTGEPKWTQIRQLRRRVVPKSLRQLIITAYHATPLAGHSGIYRTYWRVAARYWWPRMYLDVKEAVGACAHCKLANAVGQDAKTILEALSSDCPFDVIAIDIWSPGAVPDKEGNTKALTSLDTTTGFASAAILQSMQSESVARTCFASFFAPNGLPKLILIDAGSENKGTLICMCQTLGVKYHMVSPEQHDGILCERFHRYLNKVQKIEATNNQSYTQWVLGVMFATYSWNAAPIDGTNLIRSFVAKGRVFPFPIQVAEEDNPLRIPQGQGEAALSFIETNFPLWAKQSTMLQILIAERREKHRDLANKGRSVRKFNIGDLVIIRKQVQSDGERGIPAKQKFRWKGIYRVMKKESDKSYWVQKLPTTQGKGKPGTLQKYAASLMERIPSSLIVNKYLDTADTRLSALGQELISNPLEQNLGFFEFGKYVRAPSEADFAFDRVEDLWSVDLEPDSDSEDTNTAPPAKRPKINPPTEQPLTLYRKIEASKSKAVIIKVPEKENNRLSQWYVAIVDWDETDETTAKNEGIYRLRWLVPHHKDSKHRRRKDCRYWPEVHELTRKGTLGPMRPISPHKAARSYINKQGWTFYEWDTNLLTDILVGPFDLEIINGEPDRVPKRVWDELVLQAGPQKVDISNLDRVVPLK